MLDCLFFLSAKSIGWVVPLHLAPPTLGQKAAGSFLKNQGTDSVSPVMAVRGWFAPVLPTDGAHRIKGAPVDSENESRQSCRRTRRGVRQLSAALLTMRALSARWRRGLPKQVSVFF
uniref:Uncharacterized protein n=1 Tax=Ixodes ricinus TaxID=34613 RepID=A0A6B0ULK0_IXORI